MQLREILGTLSFKVRKINLNPDYSGSVELKLHSDNNKIVISNYLNWYHKRPEKVEYENMNFDTFCRIFKVSSSIVIKMDAKEMEKDVIRSVPKFPANPNSKNYWKYCKFQLICFKPSRALSELFQEDSEASEYIEKYKEFLESDSVSEYMEWLQDLQTRPPQGLRIFLLEKP